MFTLPMRKARWRPTSLSPGMRLGFQARTARNPVRKSGEIRAGSLWGLPPRATRPNYPLQRAYLLKKANSRLTRSHPGTLI